MTGGGWSIGEFSAILDGLFAASSKPEFLYEKEERLHSVAKLVFAFHISQANNKTYYLVTGGNLWECSGKLWIDKKTLRLSRLQRDTPYMPGACRGPASWGRSQKRPIHRATTTIDYAKISLGDGTNPILPTHSDVLLCAAAAASPYGKLDNCSRNVITFANWHKFRATTNIVSDPAK